MVIYVLHEEMLVFIREDQKGHNLYLYNNQQILPLTSHAFVSHPNLNPSYKEVIYVQKNRHYHSINLINIETKEDLVLTTINQIDGHPKWWHDGQQIIFSARVNAYYQIYSIQRDGYNLKPLIPHSSDQLKPIITKSAQLIYLSNRSQHLNLYISHLITGEHKRLTFDRNNDQPALSPNEKQIAYVTYYPQTSKIYLMALHEEECYPLVDNQTFNTQPLWSPDGKALYFVSRFQNEQKIFHITIDL